MAKKKNKISLPKCTVVPNVTSSPPAISVIIPLYNAEEFIGECLKSVLLQTFQDFEVIVVDDCSTDNSFKVVEEYAPKFNGRLTLTKTEKNSGGGGYIPRNIGFKIARGEYVYFLDADDFILLTALETLYAAAKDYDVDVVYTGIYYRMRQKNDVFLYRDGENKKLFREGKKDEPDLIVDDTNKILSQLLTKEPEGNFRAPWTKFLRRRFLLENNIAFPEEENLTNGGDFIWVINVYSCAKRFLRFPTPFYFYRAYNSCSVTRITRTPQEQVSHWVRGFNAWMRALNDLVDKIAVLKDNPIYGLEAAKSHFKWCLNLTHKARNELTSQDIYRALYREFSNQSSLPSIVMPFLFSIIDEDKKLYTERLQIVNKLKKELEQLKNTPTVERRFVLSKDTSDNPAVSVIMALYNAEKYLAESLDSLLAQTFQDFEIIVVDDCSTDSSCKIVESYMPKFNGRLKLFHTEKNSGGGGVPRNQGIRISRGEYIQFLDSDDMLTKTALEEMYSFAKEYDADVVYCEGDYHVDEDGSNIRLVPAKGLVDKPTLETQDLEERTNRILRFMFSVSSCRKFARRSLMIENEIFLPDVHPSEDDIWTYGLIIYAKRFLRVPNAVYIRRLSPDSMMRKERTPQQMVNFWLNPVLFGVKSLDKLIGRHEFFKANPSYRCAILNHHMKTKFRLILKSAGELTANEFYSTIKDKFGDRFGAYDVLIPALCTAIYTAINKAQVPLKPDSVATARIDIKLRSAKGDFQIFSVSDSKADVKKPEWFQKDGVGYQIQSYAGKLGFVVKSTVTGKVVLSLRSIDVRDPQDRSKRIPQWIDYTALVIKNKKVLNKATPAWHDKPYSYTLEVKADEEVKIQLEWSPHKDESVEQKLAPIVAESPIPDKFKNYLTAKIEAKFSSKKEDEDGDFQILSTSDEKADVSKPSWFQKNGIGYVISSLSGELTFVAKATADGHIKFKLRGLKVRSPEDWKIGIDKRIPYWIDYTKFTVNDEVIFDKLTPAWCDEPYNYKMNVKAGEEVRVHVEWLPHRSDT